MRLTVHRGGASGGEGGRTSLCLFEFGINHGLWAYGPSSITGAGYVPTSLDPLSSTGPRRAFNNNLANPAFKSLLVHWNVLF